MAVFTGFSSGHLALNLIDPDAIGIRVLRDQEPFQVFAVALHSPDRVHLHGLDGHEEATRRRLWRAVLAAGAEQLPAVVEAGLADGTLPSREPLVARPITVPFARVQHLCEHQRVLPELDHALVARFELADVVSSPPTPPPSRPRTRSRARTIAPGTRR
jgi:hypothetical protein